MGENSVPQNGNEYKARNILTMAERIQVIQEYDRNVPKPSLQSLAQRFECSSKQIKNILINRDTIIRQYRNGEEGSQEQPYNTTAELTQKRQEKIAFLGKVMYEYVQRMLYFNQNIDENKFRQKALQIKECIAVENFQPTNAWLDDFKATYRIPSIDLECLRNNIVVTGAKNPHLSAVDMIQYVSRLEQEQKEPPVFKRPNAVENLPKSDIGENQRFYRDSKQSNMEPKVVYEIDDENEDEEFQKVNFHPSIPKATSNHNASQRVSVRYDLLPPNFFLHNSSPHNPSPHNLSPHNPSLHNLSPHNPSPHNSLNHIPSPHNSLNHNPSPHNSLNHNPSPHNSLIYIPSPHNSLNHIPSPHNSLNHIPAPHNSLNHNSPPRNSLSHSTLHNSTVNISTPKTATKRRSTSPFPDIDSMEEVKKHITALEMYAMLRDNFRAIGLLTQLEQVFQKPEKDD